MFRPEESLDIKEINNCFRTTARKLKQTFGEDECLTCNTDISFVYLQHTTPRKVHTFFPYEENFSENELGVSIKLPKMVVNTIAPSIAAVIKKVVVERVCPFVLKGGSTIPSFKAGDISDCSNTDEFYYRLLLVNFSKRVLERKI